MRSLLVALLPILLAAPAMPSTPVDSTLYTTYVFAHASDWDSGGFYLLNKDGEGEEDGGANSTSSTARSVSMPRRCHLERI
jgi:hypothetical protein